MIRLLSHRWIRVTAWGGLLVLASAVLLWGLSAPRDSIPAGRKRVLFWHFWGGAERQVVQEVVRRFNASQHRYWVQEIAVPGQNLDMKLYMAMAGGDFPDCLNQDDQVVGQWASRGILTPLRAVATADEYQALEAWLSPAARRIGTYDKELYALCNSLDLRALYYREEALQGKSPPHTLDQFDALAKLAGDDPQRIPFLPDDRRLWAWGIVFGGRFYDEQTGTVTASDPRIVAALEWMTSYTRTLGLENVRAFRSTNRETGASSMLLEGRYDWMLDGQWRVREFDQARQLAARQQRPPFRYGVIPLPVPEGGIEQAGWVNGNFFLIPKGCRNPQGAWAFMKFWSGFGGFEAEAAKTAARGGWIPASPAVIDQPAFQAYLQQHPQFRLFVELAGSPNQWPTPNVPEQAYFFERINQATEEALTLEKSPKQALEEATRDIQNRLDRRRGEPAPQQRF